MYQAASIALISALLLAACGPMAPPHVTPDPALLTLVPADTVMLMGARLDHLRQTPFYEQHIAGKTSPALEDFIKRTGVDPRKDIWEVLAASNGIDTIVMSRGKFSETGLEPRLEEQGGERSSYKGYIMVGDRNHAVTFMNATTAIAGRPERLREIIDQRGESAGPPEALQRIVESIDRSNQIWAASVGGFTSPSAPAQGNIANLDRVLRKLKNFQAGANLNNGLVFHAEGECASTEDAETMQSALRALIGLAKIGLRQTPAVQAFLDTIAVGREGNIIRLDSNTPPDLLARMLTEMSSGR